MRFCGLRVTISLCSLASAKYDFQDVVAGYLPLAATRFHSPLGFPSCPLKLSSRLALPCSLSRSSYFLGFSRGIDKKAFLSDQCKEIEENNRMGKTRDLFKKIRDTKGTFQARMGSIKDRNGMDLTEAEDIKKRWQEYTEELYEKDLHNPDNHNSVITNLEPGLLECEVK